MPHGGPISVTVTVEPPSSGHRHLQKLKTRLSIVPDNFPSWIILQGSNCPELTVSTIAKLRHALSEISNGALGHFVDFSRSPQILYCIFHIIELEPYLIDVDFIIDCILASKMAN